MTKIGYDWGYEGRRSNGGESTITFFSKMYTEDEDDPRELKVVEKEGKTWMELLVLTPNGGICEVFVDSDNMYEEGGCRKIQLHEFQTMLNSKYTEFEAYVEESHVLDHEYFMSYLEMIASRYEFPQGLCKLCKGSFETCDCEIFTPSGDPNPDFEVEGSTMGLYFRDDNPGYLGRRNSPSTLTFYSGESEPHYYTPPNAKYGDKPEWMILNVEGQDKKATSVVIKLDNMYDVGCRRKITYEDFEMLCRRPNYKYTAIVSDMNKSCDAYDYIDYIEIRSCEPNYKDPLDYDGCDVFC